MKAEMLVYHFNWLKVKDSNVQYSSIWIQIHQVVVVLRGYKHELESRYYNCEAALGEEMAEHLNMSEELLSSIDQ
jgi:hypothetical protein